MRKEVSKVNEPEDRGIEIIHSKQQERETETETHTHTEELWDNIHCYRRMKEMFEKKQANKT